MSLTTDSSVLPLDDLVTYLRPAQRAILQHLADEKAGEVHPVVTEHLEDVVADVDPRASVSAATGQLAMWDLIESRGAPYEGGRARRYQLTDRGKKLMLEYDGELDDVAKPITEWTSEEIAAAPMDESEVLRETIGMLETALGTVADLEARVDALEDKVDADATPPDDDDGGGG